MANARWLLVPVVALCVWHGPARLVRWAISSKPAPQTPVHVQVHTGHTPLHDHESGQRVIEKSLVLAQGARCELENRQGSISVRSIEGRTARLRIEIEDDQDQQTHIDIDENDKELRVRERSSGRSSAQVDYSLELPSGVSLVVRTVSGDVEVRGVPGAVEIHSVSGDLRLSNLGGGASLETVSGEIDLDGISGKLHATTVSGDFAGTLQPGFLGGDITTVSGSVSVNAPKGADLSVRTSTLSGDIDNPFSGNESKRVLTIATTSGDIQVQKE